MTDIKYYEAQLEAFILADINFHKNISYINIFVYDVLQRLPQKRNWKRIRLKSEVLADIRVRFPAGAPLLILNKNIK